MEIDVENIYSPPNPSGKHVSIVMINSRENSHPHLVRRARNSAYMQQPGEYSIDFIEVRNHERHYTIGRCWNEAVRISAPGLIVFIGDDDYISPEFITTMTTFKAAAEKQFNYAKNFIGVSSFMRVVDHHQQIIPGAYMQASHTGMYNRQFLVENRFEENLTNNVDTEFMHRLRKNGYIVGVCEHYFGYFYTIHSDMVSGYERFKHKGTP